MVNGNFGVFDDLILLAEFGDDDSADEYRRDALDLGLYDDLLVAEIPEDYDCDLWTRLLSGLRKSRRQDLAVEKYVGVLRSAQEARHAAA